MHNLVTVFAVRHLDRFRITDKFETSDNFSYGKPTQKSASHVGANTAPYRLAGRDNSSAKVPGLESGRDCAGNGFALYTRAVRLHTKPHR
jgi:hypothetical protein